MIRKFETKDLEEVMSLWLHVNIEAHSFIETDYWNKNYDVVRKLIPEAEVFVAEDNEQIYGFIGLTDSYIAGIFVKDTEQSKGIGTELLHTVMKLKNHLCLHVYKKNMRAVGFYQHCGFKIVNQEIDENTSEEEYTMEWRKHKDYKVIDMDSQNVLSVQW